MPNPEHAQIADRFAELIRQSQDKLSPAEQRVVSFIDRNRAAALAQSATQLAADIGTSNATVVRAVQTLGFKGLAELRRLIATDMDRQPNSTENMRRTLAQVGESSELAATLVLESHLKALQALHEPEARRRLNQAVSCFASSERIVLLGIGRAGPIASYVAVMLGRIGRRARAFTASGAGLADDLLDLRRGDVLVLLANGNPYKEAVTAIRQARLVGIQVVLVTESETSKIAKRSDIVVPAPRGRTEHVSLHGTTMCVMEALVTGLAACDRDRTLLELDRFEELRTQLGGRDYVE
ncbi:MULTISPECIES: MurR/RpiR family transcriptional regulator [Rhizobium]|uniref:MurR/RpiR family transcriptional regulator n=1 Tax=Rhizobium TaxID=379 RepID=UPI001A936909|nr:MULTISPECIES: MurR/RpiR family transcriptional regulator [Rhizobium]MBY3157753.1 MurR/RpiR family transcriptional regulator [Rhizobium laguerreae]MBY5558328.1 MurR/RpiR family transcriptional regulator [Rhizobium leguminosarum]MBY5666189.1 MurR/RpiR family transcriptional regulator [Rhizobium leguminosarum]MBY5679487.1 MurR/RpiR family transcriptional regulator [Rhizobium leguminosarum]MBY5727980.1 MurR/RpiR family transcriptional regulator [Rhizobium leguminosarum]